MAQGITMALSVELLVRTAVNIVVACGVNEETISIKALRNS